MTRENESQPALSATPLVRLTPADAHIEARAPSPGSLMAPLHPFNLQLSQSEGVTRLVSASTLTMVTAMDEPTAAAMRHISDNNLRIAEMQKQSEIQVAMIKANECVQVANYQHSRPVLYASLTLGTVCVVALVVLAASSLGRSPDSTSFIFALSVIMGTGGLGSLFGVLRRRAQKLAGEDHAGEEKSPDPKE